MNKPYNLLLQEDKEKIITTYYDAQNIRLTFREYLYGKSHIYLKHKKF